MLIRKYSICYLLYLFFITTCAGTHEKKCEPKLPSTRSFEPSRLYPGPCIEFRDDKMYKPDGKYDRAFVFSYNSEGLVASEEYMDDQCEKYKTIYEYTYSDSSVIKGIRGLSKSGAVNLKTVFEYDDRGRIIAEHQKGKEEASVDISSHYEYSESGQIQRIEGFEKSKLVDWIDYEYEAAKNTVREFIGVNGYKRKSAEYKYDANGNISEKTSFGDNGEVMHVVTFTFDEAGRVLKTSVGSRNKSAPDVEFELTYDMHGNILTRTTDKGRDGTVESIYEYQYGCWASTDADKKFSASIAHLKWKQRWYTYHGEMFIDEILLKQSIKTHTAVIPQK